jgi:hypothetical protein
MPLWTEFHLDLDVDDVLRGQGADPETIRARRPALVEAAGRALTEGRALIHPIACVRELEIRERRHERLLLEGGALSGPLVARHLASARRVALAVCTIGGQLEQGAARLLPDQPPLALALDGLGNAAVEKLGQRVCRQIAAGAESAGLQAGTPLSPGAAGWPVEIGQPQVFALLDPGQAGVRLTSGGMMVPRKSMSFALGLGVEMPGADPCEVCSLVETCRYRHA